MTSSREKEDSLREAACNGDLETIRELLERDRVDINAQNPINGWTALHWGAKRNHIGVVTYLLQHGADKNIASASGEVPAQVTSNKDIHISLGGSGDVTTPGKLSITPNYMANAQLPYMKQNGEKPQNYRVTSSASSASMSGAGDHQASAASGELVLKVRVANAEERDFIEVELDKGRLTFEALVSLLCVELGVDRNNVCKIRKIPDTILRKDKDVARLREYQELEVVLTNKAISAQSRVYKGASACALNTEKILY